MRKKPKKLALNRETLHNLDEEILKEAAGGTFVSEQYTNCGTCSTPTYCGRRCHQVPSAGVLTQCESCTGMC